MYKIHATFKKDGFEYEYVLLVRVHADDQSSFRSVWWGNVKDSIETVFEDLLDYAEEGAEVIIQNLAKKISSVIKVFYDKGGNLVVVVKTLIDDLARPRKGQIVCKI